MTATSTAELAIYAVLSIPTIYILIKHGRTGLLGWLYLFAFCTLRIVGGAMDLSGNTAAGIISSVGLSPLLLATSGILHEARTYYSDVLDRKVEWASILSFHVIVTSGVAILATGASSLESDDPKSTDASLVKAGIALLTLSWAIVVAASVWTLARPGKFTNQTSAAPGTKLLWSVLVSDIFSGIRVIYALIELVTQDKSLNPLTGSLTLRVIFSLLPELISVVAFITAGILTRNVVQEAFKAKRAAAYIGLNTTEQEPILV